MLFPAATLLLCALRVWFPLWTQGRHEHHEGTLGVHVGFDTSL